MAHIDFGFLFTTSPGNINFENSPFKFTQDYLDMLDDIDSEYYVYFKTLLLNGFLALQKNIDSIITLLEII